MSLLGVYFASSVDLGMSQPPRQRRSQQTIGKYLPDFVLGANDGVITTLAVVSGVVGASLSDNVVIIMGFANLVADGISMAASNILGRRSEAQSARPSLKSVGPHGLATFIGFVAAGIVPLLAYLLPWFQDTRFSAATILALVTLFAVGAGRTFFTGRSWLASGMEMLVDRRCGSLRGLLNRRTSCIHHRRVDTPSQFRLSLPCQSRLGGYDCSSTRC